MISDAMVREAIDAAKAALIKAAAIPSVGTDELPAIAMRAALEAASAAAWETSLDDVTRDRPILVRYEAASGILEVPAMARHGGRWRTFSVDLEDADIMAWRHLPTPPKAPPHG